MIDFSLQEICEYNQIVDNLYDHRDHEEALKNFLVSIQNLVFFEKGDIYIYKNTDNHITFESYISVGYGSELKSYQEEFCEIDDVLPLISASQPVMFRSSDIFLLVERKKTDYYQNHLEPAKMHHSIEGNIYVEENGYVVGIGLHKSREHKDFTQKELQIIKLARPHLSRVAQRFCESKSNAIKLFDTASILPSSDEIGIWVFNWQSELIESNVGDNQFIRRHNDELKKTLQTLCQSLRLNIEENTEPEKSAYHMKSKIMIPKKSYYVDIVYRPEQTMEHGFFTAILYDYTSIIQNIMSDMKKQFNLTEREYEVFQCLVKGMSNQEIQDHLFISMPTVKKHLTNIYQKLGVDGQRQLMHSIL